MTEPIVNVALRLREMAARNPEQVAVAQPLRKTRFGKRRYRQLTFRELEDDTNRIAAGLIRMGVRPGQRLVLLVRPSIDFISLVFAMLKVGIVIVFIDPGIGRRNLVRCLSDVSPAGFVAIPLVHAVRLLLRHRFPRASLNVTVGRRWFWRGPTLRELRKKPADGFIPQPTKAHEPAAIIFTSGSTGPPKGVLYTHLVFDRQVQEIGDFYGIQPGEIDVPAFPLFGLFNAAMGVTTVIPDMNFSKPAAVNPRNILEAVNDWQATQAFGSPALWNVVGTFCEQRQLGMPTLRRVLSAGAPVPPHVLRRMKLAIHRDGEVHTPYGATEALPVASISGSEVLEETASQSASGAGTCVGRRFPGIQWKIIEITDSPIARIEDVVEVAKGVIGELLVQGAVVTREYATRSEANPFHKIQDGETIWHRMGDVGYLDEQDRFWFCGRKSHRVITAQQTMFTIPCEAIINQHPRVYRSALVGVGPVGEQQPVIVAEPWPERRPKNPKAEKELVDQLMALAAKNTLTAAIQHVLIVPALPVDIRHNSKIFREEVAAWATKQLTQETSYD